ncbi:MAG: putative quinol monooxygenase [Deltaproteobacteria bacterium]
MAFVVIATWKARPGEEARIREVIARMTPLSRAEAGNLFYQAQVSPKDPLTFVLYEQYVNEAAYEAHKATPHFQEHVVARALPWLESRNVVTLETIGG